LIGFEIAGRQPRISFRRGVERDFAAGNEVFWWGFGIFPLLAGDSGVILNIQVLAAISGVWNTPRWDGT
jgi:hypothetical protein